MSRTKTSDVVESTEPVETNVTAEVEKTEVTTSTTSNKKIGLEFYLQKNPQKYTIAQLMRSKYKKCVMTEKEWNDTLAKLLGKKVIS